VGFLQDLTGASARKDLKRARKASEAALKEGFDAAMVRYDEGYDELEPYATSGTEANTRYNQLLGLGTDEERAAGQQTYLSDPIFGAILNQQSNALLRQQNARGATYGGQTVQMGGRLGLEAYQGYLDRLRGQGDQGFQATGARSNIRLGQGDAAWNYGATRAGNAINYGNASAANRGTGINNLLNIAGTAAKAYTAFSDIRLKRNITHVGEMPSGLPVYEFEYVFGPERFRGVMAHEAAAFFPEAVSTHKSGYLQIDYSQIG
jgi:hypothetical protein